MRRAFTSLCRNFTQVTADNPIRRVLENVLVGLPSRIKAPSDQPGLSQSVLPLACEQGTSLEFQSRVPLSAKTPE